MAMTQNTTRYIPVAKFDQYYPWPTPQGWRNRIHAAKRDPDADPNFLKCVKKVGGRLLIDELAFLTWVETQSADDAA